MRARLGAVTCLVVLAAGILVLPAATPASATSPTYGWLTSQTSGWAITPLPTAQTTTIPAGLTVTLPAGHANALYQQMCWYPNHGGTGVGGYDFGNSTTIPTATTSWTPPTSYNDPCTHPEFPQYPQYLTGWVVYLRVSEIIGGVNVERYGWSIDGTPPPSPCELGVGISNTTVAYDNGEGSVFWRLLAGKTAPAAGWNVTLNYASNPTQTRFVSASGIAGAGGVYGLNRVTMPAAPTTVTITEITDTDCTLSLTGGSLSVSADLDAYPTSSGGGGGGDTTSNGCGGFLGTGCLVKFVSGFWNGLADFTTKLFVPEGGFGDLWSQFIANNNITDKPPISWGADIMNAIEHIAYANCDQGNGLLFPSCQPNINVPINLPGLGNHVVTIVDTECFRYVDFQQGICTAERAGGLAQTLHQLRPWLSPLIWLGMFMPLFGLLWRRLLPGPAGD